MHFVIIQLTAIFPIHGDITYNEIWTTVDHCGLCDDHYSNMHDHHGNIKLPDILQSKIVVLNVSLSSSVT